MPATSSRSCASIHARTQRALGLLRHRLAAPVPVAPQRRVRALQGAVDGGDGRVEQLGGLRRRPAHDVARDDDRPLARRQQLDDGEERELDRLARRPCRRAASRRRAGSTGPRRRTRPSAGAGRARFSASRQAFVAIRYSQARAFGPPANVVARTPRPQQRLLDGVLRLLERGEHPVAVDVQLAAMARAQRREVPFGEHAGETPPAGCAHRSYAACAPLPGLKRSCGSSASLIARMSPTAASPCSSTRKRDLP